MSMTAILDGDILIYQAASKAEELIEWEDGIWTLHANYNKACALLQDYIVTMVDKVNADDFVIAVTIGLTFRHELLPTYKANRDPRKKPMLVSRLRQWVLDTYGSRAYHRPRLEADDVMGILNTHPTLIKGDRMIVSVDKDFKTIPGVFYDYGKDETYELTEDDANLWWMRQTLSGDATDNYAGCPSVGVVTAAKLLPEPMPLKDMWDIVVGKYESKERAEEDAILQARMARILRNGDFDFKTREIKLWTPSFA